MAEGEGGDGSQTDSYDQGIQTKVEAYLAAALGQNNADVQVNATLSYDQVSTKTQSITPAANGQTASFCTQTSNSNESYSGTGTPPGGTAGTITDHRDTTPGNYTNTRTPRRARRNEQTKTVQQAPGTVESQSVAVLVNSKAIPKGLSLAALQKGVAAAAGINTARGDQLAFSSMPFNTAAAQQAAKAAGGRILGQPEAGHGSPDQGGGRLPDHRHRALPPVAIGQEGP